MKLKLTNIIKETLTKKEALEAINNDFLQFVTSLGGTHEVQSDNTNVVIIDFKENYGEEAEFEYNLVTKSLHPAGISRPEDDKASALYDTLWKEKAKIFRKYIEMEKSGKINENSISRLKDKVKNMSKKDFITLVKKVGDLDKWKNASKGKFDDGTPIRPFSNASDRIEVIDNNFEEKDAEKYLTPLKENL